VAVATFVVPALTAVPGSAAVHRQSSGGGVLGPDYVRATARDLGAGTYTGAPAPNLAPSTQPVYDWSRAATGARCVVVAGPVTPDAAARLSPLPGLFFFPDVPAQVAPLSGAPAGGVRYDGPDPLPANVAAAGDLVVDVGTPTAADRDLLVLPRCVLPGDPLPPTPPTAVDIWEQTPLPRARIHANPPGTHAWPGVVHLQSHFWADGLPDASAAVALPGFAVDVRARAIAYAWVPGDGTSLVRTGPGSADDPVPADYVRRGDYPVTLYVVWFGIAHTTAPALGLDLGEQRLGTVTLPERTVHHVAEIRALLHS
jgi:hypothetical protein